MVMGQTTLFIAGERIGLPCAGLFSVLYAVLSTVNATSRASKLLLCAVSTCYMTFSKYNIEKASIWAIGSFQLNSTL
jgi:hypothetical protein